MIFFSSSHGPQGKRGSLGQERGMGEDTGKKSIPVLKKELAGKWSFVRAGKIDICFCCLTDSQWPRSERGLFVKNSAVIGFRYEVFGSRGVRIIFDGFVPHILMCYSGESYIFIVDAFH